MAHTTKIGNFSVASVEFGVTQGTNIADTQSTAVLTLIPDEGFTLTAADFSYTSGPSEVQSVSFSQSGNNVLATVTFAAGASMPASDLDIPICIAGESGLVQYTLSGIVETIASSNVTPASGNTSFSISGNVGDDVQAFSHTVTAGSGYYFPVSPSGNLTTGNADNYSFTTSEATNDELQITGKTFTGVYTFPAANIANNVFTVVADAVEIPIIIREITSYTINTSNINPAGETRAMTVFGVEGAQFSLTVFNEDPTSTHSVTNQTIPATGSYSFNIIFPSVSDTDQYDFTLTGDLASPFAQDTTFSINQYVDISVQFGLTATGDLASDLTLPTNYSITYAADNTLVSTDLNYEFTATLLTTSTSTISENTAPLITDLTNLDSSTNGGTDITISSLTSSVAADGLSYTITISGNTNETGTLDVLSTLNLNSYITANVAPVANAGSFSVNKGGDQTITLIGSDGDNDSLDYIIVSLPANGNLYTDAALTDTITSVEIPYTLTANTVYYEHNNSNNFTESFTFKVNDGSVDSNIATVSGAVGVSPGASIVANGNAGIYLVPVVLGTDAGQFKVHFDAFNVPDRIQILFDDTNGTSNDIANMQVVADSLIIGDDVENDAAPFNTPPNGTTANLNLFTYNGTSFDTTETGTQSIVVTDSVVADNTGARSQGTPNGPSRNSSGGTQTGIQDLVYTSTTDTIGSTGLNYADGNICITYTKESTTAYQAYIRVYGLTNTGWSIFQTEFEEDLP